MRAEPDAEVFKRNSSSKMLESSIASIDLELKNN
jgi:hypothetical protein